MHKKEITISKGWVAQHVGIVFDQQYYFDPMHRHKLDLQAQDAVEGHFPGMQVFFSESNLGRYQFYNPAQVLVGGIQPNMILGMLLGAEFLPAPAHDADISPMPWQGRSPDELPDPAALMEHEVIQLFSRQIEQVNDSGEMVAVPPLFWDSSGRAAIHGVLTTAQKLCGEDVFMDLLVEPERAVQLLNWIADGFVAMLRHFSPSQPGGLEMLHIGECSACMVDPAMFAGQIVPVLNRICDELDCEMRMHSCGPSDHLLEPFKQMPRLTSLDLGGETSVARVREIFGAGLHVSIAPPVSLLTSNDTVPLREWMAGVREANDGGNLTFLLHIEAEYPMAIVETFAQEAQR